MSELLVDTPEGSARTTTSTPSEAGLGTLVLGHGAGGLRWTKDVLAVRDEAVTAGWTVVLVDQPWRVAGRRLGPAPPILDRAWRAVLDSVHGSGHDGRLVVGGRSAGARVACRTAADVGADAVVALSFPLHPPGRPDRSRAGELALPGAAGIRVHVIQGRTDPFGGPDDVAAALPEGSTVDAVAGTHSLGGSATRVAALVVARLSSPAVAGSPT